MKKILEKLQTQLRSSLVKNGQFGDFGESGDSGDECQRNLNWRLLILKTLIL